MISSIVCVIVAVQSSIGGNAPVDGATYIGSQECEECHIEKYDYWQNHSKHSGMLMPIEEADVLGEWNTVQIFQDPDLGTIQITLSQSNDDYNITLEDIDQPANSATYQIHYTIGGVGWKQRYTTKIGNSYYVLPIQWNKESWSWSTYRPQNWFQLNGGTGNGATMSPDTDTSWDRSCGGCHTTGYEVSQNQTSGEYTGTWSEPGIACEACHGPGSIHKQTTKDSTATPAQKRASIVRTSGADLCGRCHIRAADESGTYEFPTGYQVGNSSSFQFIDKGKYWGDGNTSKAHNQQYLDWMRSDHAVALETLQTNSHAQDSCMECHSVDYRQIVEKNDPANFTIPTLETAQYSITCALCHNPHGSLESSQLRMDAVTLCTSCHTTGTSMPGDAPHHPQKEMRLGVPYMPSVRCPDCHMSRMASTLEVNTNGYGYDIAGHAFEFIGPEKTLEYAMPNSCNVNCHNGIGPEKKYNATDFQSLLDDAHEQTSDRLSVTEISLAGAASVIVEYDNGNRSTDLTTFHEAKTKYLVAKYNLDFVKADSSLGGHNPIYIGGLLNQSDEYAALVINMLSAPDRLSGISASFGEDGLVTVTWSKSQSLDFNSYRIYGSSEQLSSVDDLEPISTITDIDTTSYDFKPDESGTLYLTVTAVDSDGNEIVSGLSEASIVVSAAVQAEGETGPAANYAYMGIIAIGIVALAGYLIIRPSKKVSDSGDEKDAMEKENDSDSGMPVTEVDAEDGVDEPAKDEVDEPANDNDIDEKGVDE
jgi:predicted CXXCH cytochrome family protein